MATDPILAVLERVQGRGVSVPPPRPAGADLLVPSHARGPLLPGNIDLAAQPRVKNPDGTTSTVRSISINIDGREVLIPTVVGNRVVSDDEAIREYERTGRHLGMFDTPQNATAYASQLHDEYAAGRYDSREASPAGAGLLVPSHRREDPDILLALDKVQEAPSLTERAIPMAMRVGGAIVGGIAGIPGGPPGVMALGASGAGLGEIAAQEYETRFGGRTTVNPAQVVTQTALGAIPAGRAFGSTVPRIVASRGAQGGLLGGGSTVATQLAETGELPSRAQLATGVGLGTVLGGTVGAVEGRAVARDQPPIPPRGPLAALPPGTRFQVAPDGRVVAVGTDIPMTQAPDGSFAHATPTASYFDDAGQQVFVGDPGAQNVFRRISGALPPGRTPMVTQPPSLVNQVFERIEDARAAASRVDAPAGTVIEPVEGGYRIVFPDGLTPAATPRDASGGRGVRAAVASFDSEGRPVYSSDHAATDVVRPVRGALPAGPRFVAAPDGVVATADETAALMAALDRVQGRTPGAAVPDASGGRTVPAAPVTYNIDPHVPAKRGITVAQVLIRSECERGSGRRP